MYCILSRKRAVYFIVQEKSSVLYFPGKKQCTVLYRKRPVIVLSRKRAVNCTVQEKSSILFGPGKEQWTVLSRKRAVYCTVQKKSGVLYCPVKVQCIVLSRKRAVNCTVQEKISVLARKRAVYCIIWDDKKWSNEKCVLIMFCINPDIRIFHFLFTVKILKGVFAKNERRYRVIMHRILYRSLPILLISVASIRRK